MPKKSFQTFVILIALSLLLGSCAASKGLSDKQYVEEPAAMYESYYDFYEAEYGYDEAEPEESAGGFVSGLSSTTDITNRMVTYNADMEIIVEDPETVLQAVIAMTQKAGGFVVNSNLTKTTTDRGTLPRATLTVRVPAGQLDSVIAAIRELTPNPSEDVLSEYVSGKDVTAEYTDLESRLRNLETAEAALAKMMDDAQEPEDVLNIFEQLTYYRGEIEVVKGRMKYLQESVALSSLSLGIQPKVSIRPIEVIGWQPKGTVKRAVEQLIEVGQMLVDALIWFGIFCLPFLIPLGVGVYFLIRFFRKRKAKKLAKKDEQVEVIEQVENSE